MKIKSPLNYTGSKFAIIDEIQNLFPKKIGTFYDVFCGGANVLININAKKYVGIDNNSKLIDLLNFLTIQTKTGIDKMIIDIVEEYNLTKSWEKGYIYYGVDSTKGLSTINSYNFIRLRNDYNFSQSIIKLLVLLFYSFNNLFRFNSKGQYNVPVGKRDYNKNIQKNLYLFIERIQKIKPTFINLNFINLKEFSIKKNDFVYFDPPYLITEAEYNLMWTQENDNQLMKLCNFLNKKNIKFAMSNVIKHHEKINIKLINWAKKNNYNIHRINKTYNNSCYNKKNKNSESTEVLITNY